MASDPFQELKAWFQDRPLWLQDAAGRIIKGIGIDQTNLDELALLCKQETEIPVQNHTPIKAAPIPIGAFQNTNRNVEIRLNSIEEVKGVNALAPKKPLEFGNTPITVIYGANGSGKSGYVRALKHACGAKEISTMLGNVFSDSSIDPSCVFNCTINGEEKKISWCFDNGKHDDLSTVEIYDTRCAHVYVNEENEVTYEPWPLSLFTDLVSICGKVDAILKSEIQSQVSSKPIIPDPIRIRDLGKWYQNIHTNITPQEIDQNCAWSQEIEQDLLKLKLRLSEPNPGEKAKTLRTQATRLNELIKTLKTCLGALSDEKKSELVSAKAEAIQKRKMADEHARRVFENAPLKGIGTESWKRMWEQARGFSEEEAYKGLDFPHVSDDSRCVLCQQTLGQEAKERLIAFDEFVQGKLELQAVEAEKNVLELEKNMDCVPSSDDIDLRAASCQILDESDRLLLSQYGNALEGRRKSITNPSSNATDMKAPDQNVINSLLLKCASIEKDVCQYEEDAKRNTRPHLEKASQDLECRKWLSEQKNSIIAEVQRLRNISMLEQARRMTNTQILSTKKSALAEVLISGALKQRFQDELSQLGANRINIAIEKSRTTKGHVFHKLKLLKCSDNVCTTDILSEGEFRVVSLAAFLADVAGRNDKATFVFDDPISSLDQDFEERTVNRLVELSKTRQVVVFTHRLSMISLLQDAAEDEIKIVALQYEPWGAGEPGDTPLNAKRPDKVLNSLLDGRLSKAKKILEESGNEAYEAVARGLCTDIRIVLERIIELDLLADVVHRFRRTVNTLNKIQLLSRIKTEDCKFMDEMMTKYSKYMHSQSSETPLHIPVPQELKTDLEKLKTWRAEFVKRPVE